jgi:hypothetical protein
MRSDNASLVERARGGRAVAAYVVWLGLLTVVGALAVLPMAAMASGLARWDEQGPDAAHHADAIVLGRVSPWPVDSDEQVVAVGFGLIVAGGLAIAAAAVHLLLRRRIRVRPAPSALLAAAVWCAPSIAFWLSWPPA